MTLGETFDTVLVSLLAVSVFLLVLSPFLQALGDKVMGAVALTAILLAVLIPLSYYVIVTCWS